jgi:hypothetical protein
MKCPVFVLRVRAEPGTDSIRSLRAWLKRGLRDFGLRCLDVHLEQRRSNPMTINLNNVETQRDRTPVPDGVYRLRARVIPGGVGSDGMLRRARNGRQLMLELECTVARGNHEGRKIWDYPTAELDESTNGTLPPIEPAALEKLRNSLRMGLVRLRAIIDSALGFDPSDRSPEMEKKRSFESYDFFDGLEFWAQIVETPANGRYGPGNQIDLIVVHGDPAYPQESRVIVPRSRHGDLDDEINF